jgi:DNA-binding LacI/PurR family transcriptional regulator
MQRENQKSVARSTIKDIALRTGLSIATVSKALNGNKRGMSENTHKIILETAKRLNYHPNLQARGLISGNPFSVGLIIPRNAQTFFSNPYFNDILAGIAAKAKESNHYILFSIDGEAYGEMYYRHLASAIVILGHRIDDTQICKIWKAGVPIVLIPGFLEKIDIPSLDIDNTNGSFKAIDYLASLGHRHIGFLNCQNHWKYHHVRLMAYLKALEKNSLSLNKNYILNFDGSQQNCYEAMKQLLSLPIPPSAVLVHNDYSAIGAIRAATEMEFRIPKDVSLIAFGDNPFTSMITPQLTTIRAPYQELGYMAMEMVLSLFNKKHYLNKKNIILPVTMVIRESTGPPRG